jgi:hypothetical protein
MRIAEEKRKQGNKAAKKQCDKDKLKKEKSKTRRTKCETPSFKF